MSVIYLSTISWYEKKFRSQFTWRKQILEGGLELPFREASSHSRIVLMELEKRRLGDY